MSLKHNNSIINNNFQPNKDKDLTISNIPKANNTDTNHIKPNTINTLSMFNKNAPKFRIKRKFNELTTSDSSKEKTQSLNMQYKHLKVHSNASKSKDSNEKNKDISHLPMNIISKKVNIVTVKLNVNKKFDNLKESSILNTSNTLNNANVAKDTLESKNIEALSKSVDVKNSKNLTLKSENTKLHKYVNGFNLIEHKRKYKILNSIRRKILTSKFKIEQGKVNKENKQLMNMHNKEKKVPIHNKTKYKLKHFKPKQNLKTTNIVNNGIETDFQVKYLILIFI